MDDTRVQNPGPFYPKPPMTKEQHHRFRCGAIVLTVIAFIIALAYWWHATRQPEVQMPNDQTDFKAEIVSMLRNSSTTSVADKAAVVKSLRTEGSKTTVSEAQKNAIVEMLRSESNN